MSPDKILELSVDIRRDAALLVRLRGDLDISSGPWLRDELQRVIRRSGVRIDMDLSGVTFMDCAGINVLLATRRRVRLEGGYLNVISASPCARRIVALSGLHRVFALQEL